MILEITSPTIDEDVILYRRRGQILGSRRPAGPNGAVIA